MSKKIEKANSPKPTAEEDDLGLDDVDSFSTYFQEANLKLNASLRKKVAGVKLPYLKDSTLPNHDLVYSVSNPPKKPAAGDNGDPLKAKPAGWRTAVISAVAAAAASTATPGLPVIGKGKSDATSNPGASALERRRLNVREDKERLKRSRSRSSSRGRRRRRTRSRSSSPRRPRPPRPSNFVDAVRYTRRGTSPRPAPRRDVSPRRNDRGGRQYSRSRSRSRSRPRIRSRSRSRSRSRGNHNTPPAPPDTIPPTMSSWSGFVPMEPVEETPEQKALKLAVEKEALQQKMAFSVQRDEYLKKRETLLEELHLLKSQRRDLSSSSAPEVLKVINENLKLQEEIKTKVQSVDHVLDMLTGLIGDGMILPKDLKPRPPSPKKGTRKKEDKKRKTTASSSSYSSDSSSSSSSDSADSKKRRKAKKKKGNYVKGEGGKKKGREQRWNFAYFDPEIHWCRQCNAFPPTARDYLLHLHSSEHQTVNQDRKVADLPWHERNDHKEPVLKPGLASMRTPIKGLQFFIPATAWFCTLCMCWMGDLHCSSLHLKSSEHNDNYQEFTDKNPSWEVDWLKVREDSLAEKRRTPDFTRHLEEQQLLQQKIHQKEEEEKQRLEDEESLVLTIPVKKMEKKRSKKSKKRQRRRGSSSSSSSSDAGKVRKSKTNKKSPPLLAQVPLKSKWEKEDSEEQISPDSSLDAAALKKKVRTRSYRWHQPGMDLSPPKKVDETIKHPEKHTLLLPESMKIQDIFPTEGIKPPIEEDTEAKFEKQAVAALMKKKPPPSLPKTKFAFIGRMPFARKKVDQSEESSKKDQDVATPDPTPPPPPVISGKPRLPMAVSNPVLTNKTKVAVAKEILTKSQAQLQKRGEGPAPLDPVVMEIDMDLEKPGSPPPVVCVPSPPRITKLVPKLPPEVTKNLGRKTMAMPLPKEFQEALNIIYPEIEPSPPPAPKIENPPLPKMKPPPPPPPSKDPAPAPPPPPIIDIFAENPPSMFRCDDDEDLALLGIESGDMAAQKF